MDDTNNNDKEINLDDLEKSASSQLPKIIVDEQEARAAKAALSAFTELDQELSAEPGSKDPTLEPLITVVRPAPSAPQKNIAPKPVPPAPTKPSAQPVPTATAAPQPPKQKIEVAPVPKPPSATSPTTATEAGPTFMPRSEMFARAKQPPPLSTPPVAAFTAPTKKEGLVAQAVAAKLPEKKLAVPQKPAADTSLPPEITVVAPPPSQKGAAPVGRKSPKEVVLETPTPERSVSVPLIEQLRSLAQTPLHPLRTFRADVEESIRDEHTSLVAIAAAEEKRRARIKKMTLPPTPEVLPAAKPGRTRQVLVLASALGLVVAGVASLAYIFIRPVVNPPAPEIEPPRLITIDEAIPLALQDLSRGALMQELVKLRDETRLSLGLIRNVYPTMSSEGGGLRLATAGEFMPKLAPSASAELVRSLNPGFVLGIHVYDGTQAILILKTSAYEQSFSGMVAWEPYMLQDLSPLFDRRVRPLLSGEVRATSTSPKVIQSEFVDQIVANHDARALYNSDGFIILVWTFIDRNTIAITTNDRTLEELTSRVRSAAIQGR